MSAVLTEARPEDQAIEASLHAIRTQGGIPVAFAGKASDQGLELSLLRGTRSHSLRGLQVKPGTGLGGQAFLTGRPASVRNYPAARGISHEYDQAVVREGLSSMVAAPVVVGDSVHSVLYGALRTPDGVGDRGTEVVVRVAAELGLHLAALTALPVDEPPAVNTVVGGWTSAVSGTDPINAAVYAEEKLRQAVAELRVLASAVSDSAVQAQLVRVCELFVAGPADVDGPILSPREIDVLRLAAAGLSNCEIAARLRASNHAITSAMRAAMRKLSVHTRHAAVSAARSSGRLP